MLIGIKGGSDNKSDTEETTLANQLTGIWLKMQSI
jgi:hypothetical protein